MSKSKHTASKKNAPNIEQTVIGFIPTIALFFFATAFESFEKVSEVVNG
jgi:hypothetical protein